jgi:hypothetical protein
MPAIKLSRNISPARIKKVVAFRSPENPIDDFPLARQRWKKSKGSLNLGGERPSA